MHMTMTSLVRMASARSSASTAPAPLPEAPETGDDLVRAEQDPVAVGELPHPGAVPGRRHQAATRVLYRLGDAHRDLLRALRLDCLFELVEQTGAEGIFVVPVWSPEPVRIRDPRDRDRRLAERFLVSPHAGERERPERDAVVRDVASDRLDPARLAARHVVHAGELPGGFNRLGSSRGEEDLAQIAGREL
jgi:hypothetical protein